MSEIIIEPGIHPVFEDATQDKYDKTKDGDPNSHMWNGQVSQRISAYAPSLVTVDSMEPTDQIADDALQPGDKSQIWTQLPGKPSELNGQDEIFVLAGDNLYSHPDPKSPGVFFLRSLTGVGSITLSYAAAAKLYDLCKAQPVSYDPYAPLEPGQIYDWEEEERKQSEAVENQAACLEARQIRRRDFIKMAGVSLATATFFAPEIAAYSPFRFTERAAEKVSDKTGELDLVRAVNPYDALDYVDGRTALLIAKMKDTIKRGGYGERAAVVLGAGHLPKAGDLLSDGRQRANRIRRLTELLVNKAKADKNFFDEKSKPAERAQWMIDYQRRIQVFRILEPDEKRFKANPTKEIDRIVKLVDTYESPSVKAATENIVQTPAI